MIPKRQPGIKKDWVGVGFYGAGAYYVRFLLECWLECLEDG